jgi:hypothetical protein
MELILFKGANFGKAQYEEKTKIKKYIKFMELKATINKVFL